MQGDAYRAMMTPWQLNPSMDLRQRVMIIAHDNSLNDILKYALEAYDFKPISCSNYIDALFSPNHRNYDYVIADFDTPVLHAQSSRAEYIRSLRERHPEAIIIGLSSKDCSMELLRAGANDFMLMPFAPYKLIMMLRGKELLS